MPDTSTKELNLGPQGDVCAEGATLSQQTVELWPILWRRVFRHAYALARNQADAEDITQEVFVVLFEESNSGRAIEKVNAWLRVVTRNISNRRFRKVRPDLHTSIDEMEEDGHHQSVEPVDPNPSAEQLMIEDDLLRIGVEVLGELHRTDREIVMMYFRGYDFSQIGTALGVSRWTARRNTLNAIQKLQKRIDRSVK